jgi:tetratricopeptide (TPR) repeat protein
MSMKRILWLLIAALCVTNALAIDQLGIAYRYNGKKQRTPIGGVYVKVATSRNGVVSDKKNGQFVLKLDGLGMGDPLGMVTVSKRGMVVLNKDEVAKWNVQKKPLILILCDANEFQKLKDRLVAIGRSQAKKKHKQELAKLEAMNAKKQLTLEQYYAKQDSIDKKMEHALARMDEYADLFARIDESEIDAVSQKAFDLFKQGHIDEAIDLFKKNEQKTKSPSIREKAEEMLQLVDSAQTLAQRDIDEYTKQAKAYAEALKYKGEWEEAGRVLKELANALGTYEAMMGYADFARRQNQYAEAETYYKLCKDKIAPLVKTNPELYEPQLAKVYINLGVVYYCTKRFNESEQMHKAALQIRKRLADANPQAHEPDLAVCYKHLGLLYFETQRYAESEQMHKAALQIRKRLADANPQTYESDLADNYNNLACLYRATQRYAESELLSKTAMAIYKRLADANPQACEPDLARSYNNLANLYSDTQRFTESEKMYKDALDIFKRLTEFNPQAYEPDLAATYYNLANLYSKTQRYDESEQMHKATIAIYERLYEGAPQQYQSRLAKGYFDYGMAMLNNNKSNEAIEPVERSLKLCKDMMNDKPDTALYAANLSCLVGLHNTNKDYATAYTYNKELLPLLKDNYSEEAVKWKVVYSGQLLSQSFYANVLGKFEEGELHSLEALKVDSTQHLAYTNLAAAYLLQGKDQAAEKLYRQYKSELKEGFLSDFDELAKAGVIPAERKADVEKIKKMLNE